ncbi:MAG: hypothetical protein LUP94_01785 [Candidatus Methanomethylicus sp.]|nr:hypothetical protein [Candidatus Methanomethylicus sp.]
MSEKDEKKMETMQKQMEETMVKMKKEFDEKMDMLEVEAQKTLDKSRDVVREHPLTSLGIAFGVGLIVGAILLKSMDKD